MGASYIIEASSATDAAAKIEQMNSEQAALLTLLGLTQFSQGRASAVDDRWKITSENSGNGFTVSGGSTGTMYVKDEIGGPGTSSVLGGGTGTYHHFMFAESSIMITVNTNTTPINGCYSITIVTKNKDGGVVVISTTSNDNQNGYEKVFVKDKNYGQVSLVPMFYGNYQPSDSNFQQIALANIPMQGVGKLCDNAFLALCKQSIIYSDLAILNGTEYASGATTHMMYACR